MPWRTTAPGSFSTRHQSPARRLGTFTSLWRATGQPGQGAIPTAAAVPDHTMVGCMSFTQQTAPASSYIAWGNVVCSNSAMTLEIHDRLAHMGGLSGTVATAQTVNIDLSTLLATNNLSERIGDSNYSDVQWQLEWYTATGTTAVTAVVNVTYSDGSTGALSNVALAASRPASLMIPLNSYIPAAKSGLYIRGVVSVALSATTGTAGNFGVTATRPRTVMPMNLANKTEQFDWAALGASKVPNSSCLFPIILNSTTSTGTVRGGGKIAHG